MHVQSAAESCVREYTWPVQWEEKKRRNIWRFLLFVLCLFDMYVQTLNGSYFKARYAQTTIKRLTGIFHWKSWQLRKFFIIICGHLAPDCSNNHITMFIFFPKKINFSYLTQAIRSMENSLLSRVYIFFLGVSIFWLIHFIYFFHFQLLHTYFWFDCVVFGCALAKSSTIGEMCYIFICLLWIYMRIYTYIFLHLNSNFIFVIFEFPQTHLFPDWLKNFLYFFFAFCFRFRFVLNMYACISRRTESYIEMFVTFFSRVPVYACSYIEHHINIFNG